MLSEERLRVTCEKCKTEDKLGRGCEERVRFEEEEAEEARRSWARAGNRACHSSRRLCVCTIAIGEQTKNVLET